jgi:ssDNA-binding Zn-finger/Zn-ribbon topoisomerase 1
VDPVVVECLQCGTTRVARRDRFKHFESPECPECGYLGWAPVLEVREAPEVKAAERGVPREPARVERRLPSVA